MAGDWIKMEKSLGDKPEVRRLARALGVSRYDVIGRLHAVWAWADTHSLSGSGMDISEDDIDDIASLIGFADALRQVGWLKGRATALEFPNFDRHNGQTAKRRAMESLRMREKRTGRKCDANICSHEIQTKCELEKIREEKKEETVMGRVAQPSVSAADAGPYPATPQEVMDYAESLPLADRPKSAYALERSCLAFGDWMADPGNRRRVPDWRRKLASWLKQDALREAEREANSNPQPRKKTADDYRLMPRKQQ